MPAKFRHSIERITLAGGVVVEDVLSGELGNNEGVASVPSASCPPYLWFVLPYPLDLGPERLAGEVLPRVGQDRLRTIAAAEQVDLRGRSGIDAIKDGRPEGFKICVAEHKTWTHTADADRDDRPRAGAGQDLADGLGRLPTRYPRHLPRPSPDAARKSGAGAALFRLPDLRE